VAAGGRIVRKKNGKKIGNVVSQCPTKRGGDRDTEGGGGGEPVSKKNMWQRSQTIKEPGRAQKRSSQAKKNDPGEINLAKKRKRQGSRIKKGLSNKSTNGG